MDTTRLELQFGRKKIEDKDIPVTVGQPAAFAGYCSVFVAAAGSHAALPDKTGMEVQIDVKASI